MSKCVCNCISSHDALFFTDNADQLATLHSSFLGTENEIIIIITVNEPFLGFDIAIVVAVVLGRWIIRFSQRRRRRSHGFTIR